MILLVLKPVSGLPLPHQDNSHLFSHFVFCFHLQLNFISTHQDSSQSQTSFLFCTLLLGCFLLPCILGNLSPQFNMIHYTFSLIPSTFQKTHTHTTLLAPHKCDYMLFCVCVCASTMFYIYISLVELNVVALICLFLCLPPFPRTIRSMDQRTHITCIYIFNTVPLTCEDSMIVKCLVS